MNITLGKSFQNENLRTTVSPYFTLKGNVTNHRVVSAINISPITETNGTIRMGNQSFSDSEGGILSISSEGIPDGPDLVNVLKIDTEGQILNQTLPTNEEMFLISNVL